MTPESYSDWKNVYKDFLQSGCTKEEYCQEKGLSLKWFERQNRKPEGYEKRFPQGVPEKQKSPTQKSLNELFVELIPDSLKPEAVEVPQAYPHPIQIYKPEKWRIVLSSKQPSFFQLSVKFMIGYI